MSTVHALVKSFNFAAIKHKDQKRKDKDETPYINHPIGVSYILTNEADVDDLEVLQAAVLHDTVEDTDTTFEEIEREFGKRVCHIVRECTDDKSLLKEIRKEQQIINAPNSSYEAKLVKLADKLYNLRDLEKNPPKSWNDDRIMEYFKWSRAVINGLRGTNKAMEDSLDVILNRNIK